MASTLLRFVRWSSSRLVSVAMLACVSGVAFAAAEVREFKALIRQEARTRAATVMTVFGMAEGASVQYNQAEGDALWQSPETTPIKAYFTSALRTENTKLVWDIRGITEESETWDMPVSVAAKSSLKLVWDTNLKPEEKTYSMPDTYTYTLVDGATRINMLTTTEYLLEAPADAALSKTLQIVVSRKTKNTTITLKAGWNQVGAALKFDQASAAKFADYIVMGYKTDEKTYGAIDTFAAGQGFWVYVRADQIPTGEKSIAISVDGYEKLQAGTALKKGWNLVTPLYSTDPIDNPKGDKVTAILTWNGKKYVALDTEKPEVGRAYWMLATEDTVIWTE